MIKKDNSIISHIYNPVNIKEYFIYDVLHNDNNEIVVITPNVNNTLNISYNNNTFTKYCCPYRHTNIYVCLSKTKYEENITLDINNTTVTTKVSKYPKFNDEIIMSTLVKNEDSIILQWINFHLNIGIDRIIIYDNSSVNDNLSYCSIEKTSNLKELLKHYINSNNVILINWSYSKRLKINNRESISGQTTQQNHSIYAFQNSKYIGLFDVDEYVNIQNETNISRFFRKLIKEEKIDISKIGSFRLLNKFFYNPNNLPIDGYKFLHIYNCNNHTKKGREKNFVLPKNVNTFGVHMITKGKQMYNVNPKKIYFNHYCYLNKATRGRNKTELVDKSIKKHIEKFVECANPHDYLFYPMS